MESRWKWDGIYMESTWNPPYSMWNIGGRKSPKWVRSQPKHIPCGMGRIHVEQYGFHIDSTWNPCGIRGHGKDLIILAPGCWSYLNSPQAIITYYEYITGFAYISVVILYSFDIIICSTYLLDSSRVQTLLNVI